MELIHGGDWAGFRQNYGKQPLDFSASISPLGLPDGVRSAVEHALKTADRYPDPLCRDLCAALADYHGLAQEQIVCGNGATDLIYRICHTMQPKHAAVLAPGFAEYAGALREEGCEITEIRLPERNGFRLTEAELTAIPENCELFFLCNPNNPTGLLAEKESLRTLLVRCRESGMHLVADECFLDFTDVPEEHSLIPELRHTGELTVLRAFTKTWAMAGLRLGYLLCGDAAFAERLRCSGQPWAVSSLAQAAGIAALREQDYLHELRNLIEEQRERMKRELTGMGLRVIPGEANFLLFQSKDTLLGAKLLERGILIRNCRNFSGLGEGWYRVAIREAEENSRLLRAIREEITHG